MTIKYGVTWELGEFGVRENCNKWKQTKEIIKPDLQRELKEMGSRAVRTKGMLIITPGAEGNIKSKGNGEKLTTVNRYISEVAE